jgi:hypothetical protein
LEIASRNIAAVQETAVALVPTDGKGGELVVRAKEAGGYLVRFGRSSQGRVDDGVRVIRNVRRPISLISSFVHVQNILMICSCSTFLHLRIS